jgi:hypothetical protein
MGKIRTFVGAASSRDSIKILPSRADVESMCVRDGLDVTISSP